MQVIYKLKSPFTYHWKNNFQMTIVPHAVYQVVNNAWRNDIAHPYLGIYIKRIQLSTNLHMQLKMEKTRRRKIEDIQAVVTIIACIFIEVISNVITSVTVWSILEINDVEFLWKLIRLVMRSIVQDWGKNIRKLKHSFGTIFPVSTSGTVSGNLTAFSKSVCL